MLDKKLLQDWRDHQEQKKRIKMAENNVFSCIFDGLVFALTFKDEEETIIVRRAGIRSRLQDVIHRTEINGHTPADEPGLTLEIAFVEEAERDPYMFYFPNRVTMLAATSALENFLRERVNLPTPPSTFESE